MINNKFIEIGLEQSCKENQSACGDLFLSQRLQEDGRIIAVLADGLGSGIKASVLSTVTAAMASACVRGNMNPHRTAEVILKSLPVCRERGLAYATFTIVDIDVRHNRMRVIEHENPRFILIRDGRAVQPPVETVPIKSTKLTSRHHQLLLTNVSLRENDRVLFFSDGITQAGLGTARHPHGWGRDNICKTALELTVATADLSARDLAAKIFQRARAQDNFTAKDDMTCASLYYRQPRRLLVVTGPPYDPANDPIVAQRLRDFPGNTMICGGSTAALVARELGREVQINIRQLDPGIPPASQIEGIDLVTEGTITLDEVLKRLRQGRTPENTGNNAVARAVAMLLRSDRIHFIVGSRVNNAHQDPANPRQLDLRRNMVRKLCNTLEEKHLKETSLELA